MQRFRRPLDRGRSRQPTLERANVLGVFAVGPNPAACLVQNGVLVAMAEEERFRRHKDLDFCLPLRAVEFCLSFANVDPEEVDSIAFAWDAGRHGARCLLSSIARWLRHGHPYRYQGVSKDSLMFKALMSLAGSLYHHPSVIRQLLRIFWPTSDYFARLPRVRFVPHHLAHAASAFYCSGFDKANILTMDRYGEDWCTALWEGEHSDLTVRKVFRLPHSLGWFYSGFTTFLGFTPERDEGKVMGLAAYGRYDPEIASKVAKLMKIGEGSYSIDPTFLYYGGSKGDYFSDRLVSLFGHPRGSGTEATDRRYADLAYAVQKRLEDAELTLVHRLKAETQFDKLCIAGGVGLNCAANGTILRRGLVADVFVQPAANDAGSALGAALQVSREMGFDPRSQMTHAYYGPGFSDADVQRALDSCGVAYEYHEYLEEVVAQELARGKVVGWFQGRMEVGPRALGNRSILADPRVPAMKDRVNNIKGREPWRPLAPSLLDEARNEYFVGARRSPFMAFTFQVRSDRKERIPAVVHVDGTTRPQTVDKSANPRFRRLLECFAAETGVPALINTSFNTCGEPIVCSPLDAIRTFSGSGLDLLAMGNFLVRKGSVPGLTAERLPTKQAVTVQ